MTTRLQELAARLPLDVFTWAWNPRLEVLKRVSQASIVRGKRVLMFLSFDMYSFIVCVHVICDNRFSPFSCGSGHLRPSALVARIHNCEPSHWPGLFVSCVT